ncbi:hypothetical protein P153DRAFT_370325 [Dothidotthia symphoricarpi CBS 119687]|uniref:Uncharacterized protein n=1 Tax=Dothidotthia symphoricarpi CBS 119687 TaxID=1392245 RepID=A0A6A5ZZM4_9PLEO|nr:uncharacterized protein P153DRAFT_370325 [Dothidotthia symphoricarpi CBS 119687]KAF2125000.1 hypothetical protein P153DRAFT_370325 [Dothidotthia symphoricarpi CBS 119687]
MRFQTKVRSRVRTKVKPKVKRSPGRDWESELREVRQRICAGKRKELALANRLCDIDDEIQELVWERAEVILQRNQILSESIEPVIESYSRAFNQSLMAKMRKRLPLELRDMIYAHLWDFETLDTAPHRMFSPLKEPCRESKGKCKTSEHAHDDKPHFVNPDFVGREASLEIVKAWYKAAAISHGHLFFAYTSDAIKSLLTTDAFHVGLNPATVLRAMTIDVNLDCLAAMEKQRKVISGTETTDMLDIPSLQQEFEPLLKVKNKTGFKLTFDVTQWHIRLNVWKEMFEVVKPVVDVFKKEGAIIRVIFKCHYHLDGYIRLEGELDTASIFPPPTWHQDAVAHFDKLPHIPESDRDYRYENDPDYDPDEDSNPDPYDYFFP